MRGIGFIAVLLALGVLAPASALSDTGGSNRPFQSTSSGVTTVRVTTGELQNSSTGTATHLGLFARQDVAHVLPHPGAPSTYDGTSTLTAADGDQIVLHCVGTSVSTDAGAHSTSVVDCAITSGTGRFSEASGWLTSTSRSTLAGFDGATMTATYDSESVARGEISY